MTNAAKTFREFKKPKSQNGIEVENGLSNYVFGKVQPQALDLEEVVLGALMLDREAVYEVMPILRPESFYKDAHQTVYQAMVNLYTNNDPIDVMTVVQEVLKLGKLEAVGGPYFISQLTNRVASSANVAYHAKIVAEKALQRQMIAFGTELIRNSYENTTDVKELFNNTDIGMMKMREQYFREGTLSNVSIAKGLMDDIEKAKTRSSGTLGESLFGIPELDKQLNGAEEDDFILIAGRPGMGKSSLGNSIIKNCIEQDISMAFWSLEMTAKKTYARAVSGMTGVAYGRIIRGQISQSEQEQVYDAMTAINNSKVSFLTERVNIHEFRSQVIALKRKKGIRAVVFDRIGLMKKTRLSMSDFDHISEVSPIFRAVANEVGIPIIAISQLSRDVEKRGGAKRPQLSDLRNSGALEQDATKVIFCFRPEYYGTTEDENGNSLVGKGELIIAKNSNGPTTTVKADFEGSCMIFREPSEDEASNTASSTAPENKSVNTAPTVTVVNEVKDDLPF